MDADAALDMAQQVRGSPHLVLLVLEDLASLRQMDSRGGNVVLAWRTCFERHCQSLGQHTIDGALCMRTHLSHVYRAEALI